MADNAQTFVSNPVSLDISRSKFDLTHTWSGTFKAGMCIPTLAYSDILPGDTFKIGADFVIRSTTPVAPVMDQAYCDLYFFFVPHKLVLGRESMSTATSDGIHSFEAFMGAQDSLLNMPLPSNSSLPVVNLNAGITSGFVHSFADYIGVNGYNLTGSISITPFEALSYAKIWNDYFRDPNTMTPLSYSIVAGEVSFYGGANTLSGYSAINNTATGYNLIQPACRYHGYFGSCLPWPQRNSTTVSIPLGDTAPIIAGTSLTDLGNPLQLGATTSGGFIGSLGSGGGSNNVLYNGTWSGSTSNTIQATNLEVDLRNAIAPSVNAFRLSVQTQKWYEALARTGNRLSNLVSMFGVTPHDVTSDTPEYLGGIHCPLTITQVANTAGTTYSVATQQAIGSTGAFSLTAKGDYICTKSFDTWGTIMCIMVIRPHESFSQGIHRRFFRKDRLQYYWTQFANLGEQAVLEREIYATGVSSNDEKVFGYQEAWAEYRFLPDVVTSDLRKQLASNIGYWTYANNFGSAPTLAGYLNGNEIYKNFDDTLQVNNSTAGYQFMAQITFNITAVRPMPTYSIPGLVDHH